MRVFIFIFATVLSLVISAPTEDAVNVLQLNEVSPQNSIIEQNVLDLLEDLRNTILNGSEDTEPLDPLNIDNVELDLGTVGLPNSFISASDAVVKNLGTFVVNHLNIALSPTIFFGISTMDIDLQIPVLDASAANYNLDANLAGFRIFGNGKAEVAVINPRVTARIQFRVLLLSMRLQIQTADVKIYVEEFKSSLTGVFDGDEELNDFVNKFLEALIPEALDFFQEDISNMINPIVVEIGNEILSDINISDFLPISTIT